MAEPPGRDDPSPLDALLAGARAGMPWALERVYAELAPAVAGYLRVQGAREPDDLTSEVFVGVLRGLPRFEGTWSDFRSWVFTIAHHRLHDERRRSARRPRLSSLDPDVHPDAVWVHDDVATGLATERVRRLCDRLAPDQRSVLLLRLVADLTVDQVASLLDKSPGAVKALQRRGLEALRRVLAAEGVPL